MSGPKVVRIVTREEVMALCRGHLARVDAALAEWLAIGKRNECIDDEAIRAMRKRRDALAALLAADRFIDLQKQAPLEEAFLAADMQRRLTKAAEERASARTRARRTAEAGASLLAALQKAGRSVDDALAAKLQAGDADAVAKGFFLLSESRQDAGASSELSRRLAGDMTAPTFESWLQQQPRAEQDPAIERIERRIDELEQIRGRSGLEALRTRIDSVAALPPERRGLAIDALEVETGRALKAERQRQQLIVPLTLLQAELVEDGANVDIGTRDARSMDASAIEVGIAEARAALDTRRAAVAAAARRTAVLKELTGLGYEVAEGMSTTLVEDGRLVLKHSARPLYGMEVTASPGSARLQLRAIAFDDGQLTPDASRDRDAETIWCGDVAALERSLAATGGGLVIEKALPIGATPLKRIATESVFVADAGERPVLRERTLR